MLTLTLTSKGLREAKNKAVSSQCTGNEETHERLLRFIVAARDGMWREVCNFAATVPQ